MSERLTKRTENGGVQFSNGEYWNTVYPQNENCLTDIHRIAIRLCEIEDKICEGRMVELPCSVGEIVYVIEPLWYGIWGDDEHKCRKCEHFYEGGMGDSSDCSLGKNCCYHIVEEETDLRKIADWITPSSFTKEIAWGKTVFLDRSSAEAKLREMEGERE